QPAQAPARQDNCETAGADTAVLEAKLGVMTQLTQRIDAALQSALDQKRLVGAVIAVMQDGELAHFKAYGASDREAGRAMKDTDIFRLASITKPLVTAAAMRMIELGKLSLDTPAT